MGCHLNYLPQLHLPARFRKHPTKHSEEDRVQDSNCVQATDRQEKQQSAPISAFLYRLPAEIRLLIFYKVFANHVFHLDRLPADRKPNLHQILYPRGTIMNPHQTILGDHPLHPRPMGGPEQPDGLIDYTSLEYARNRRTKYALLLTCRQIYNEASDVFYNASTLRFDDPCVLLDLAANYMSTRHLVAIRRIEIVWRCRVYHLPTLQTSTTCGDHSQLAWDSVWRLFANDVPLSSLKVWMILSGNSLSSARHAKWIQSFLNLHDIPHCEIFVDSSGFWEFEALALIEFRTFLREQLRQNGNRIIQPAIDKERFFNIP